MAGFTGVVLWSIEIASVGGFPLETGNVVIMSTVEYSVGDLTSGIGVVVLRYINSVVLPFTAAFVTDFTSEIDSVILGSLLVESSDSFTSEIADVAS